MASSKNEMNIIYTSKIEQGSRQPPLNKNGVEGDVDTWGNYGWIKIEKITNKSSKTLEFTNPYEDKTGKIETGKSESNKCIGYLPYTSSLKHYLIKYYNTVFNEWTELLLKDVEYNWLMSVSTNRESKIDQDIREVCPNPASGSDWAKLEFVVNDNGYEIYDPTWNCVIASLTWTTI